MLGAVSTSNLWQKSVFTGPAVFTSTLKTSTTSEPHPTTYSQATQLNTHHTELHSRDVSCGREENKNPASTKSNPLMSCTTQQNASDATLLKMQIQCKIYHSVCNVSCCKRTNRLNVHLKKTILQTHKFVMQLLNSVTGGKSAWSPVAMLCTKS